jgi:hypothetical protein
MTTAPIAEQEPAGPVSDTQLIAMPVDRARRDGLKLTGEGGRLQACGLLARILGRVTRAITRPGQMFWVGLLFGSRLRHRHRDCPAGAGRLRRRGLDPRHVDQGP